MLRSSAQVFIFGLALAFVLVINGAVPFLAMPTLLQALWTTGFAQSFVNHSLFSIHATNFGGPAPAPIAFGLAGAYPAGLFIAAGAYPADAYSLTAALWFTLAFFGAYRVGLKYNLRGSVAVFAAVLWMSMPMVWGLYGYSMLSFGIALLPFYFWTTLRILSPASKDSVHVAGLVVLYLITCLIAVFMDGYSFMMFATGSALLFAFALYRHTERRSYLLGVAVPAYLVSFMLAYWLYTAYVGTSHFPSMSMNYFRGWGVDLAFIAIPTQGMHWLWDTLGLSAVRSHKMFFGDWPVWGTTFSAPIIVAGLVAWFRTRKKVLFSTGILIVALFGLYMSLGPSLKVHATKPAQMVKAGKIHRSMPKKLALAPTGNAVLYEHLPGFKNMRAAYRWLALAVCGFWLLLVMAIGQMDSKRLLAFGVLILVALFLSNLPHPVKKWQQDVAYRQRFVGIDTDVVHDFQRGLHKGDLVAFLPYGNDFLVNYLASRLKIKTYNIGGDKNLAMAKEHWPAVMSRFKQGQVGPLFATRVISLLARGEANVVILTYINMRTAPWDWPDFGASPDLGAYEQQLDPAISTLRKSKFVTVKRYKYYASVRVAPRFQAALQAGNLEQLILSQRPAQGAIYPVTLSDRSRLLPAVLGSGWHALETDHVWSGRHAQLHLPIPGNCVPGRCTLFLRFSTFGASGTRPVDVHIHVSAGGKKDRFTLKMHDGGRHKVAIPVLGRGVQTIGIDVPSAVSPHDLTGAHDPRVLGISLLSIGVNRNAKGNAAMRHAAGTSSRP